MICNSSAQGVLREPEDALWCVRVKIGNYAFDTKRGKKSE